MLFYIESNFSIGLALLGFPYNIVGFEGKWPLFLVVFYEYLSILISLFMFYIYLLGCILKIIKNSQIIKKSMI